MKKPPEAKPGAFFMIQYLALILLPFSHNRINY